MCVCLYVRVDTRAPLKADKNIDTRESSLFRAKISIGSSSSSSIVHMKTGHKDPLKEISLEFSQFFFFLVMTRAKATGKDQKSSPLKQTLCIRCKRNKTKDPAKICNFSLFSFSLSRRKKKENQPTTNSRYSIGIINSHISHPTNGNSRQQKGSR